MKPQRRNYYLFSVVETSYELTDELNHISDSWIIETFRRTPSPKNSNRITIEVFRRQRTPNIGHTWKCRTGSIRRNTPTLHETMKAGRQEHGLIIKISKEDFRSVSISK